MALRIQENEMQLGWIRILQVANAAASCAYYCEKLGFAKQWEHKFGPK